MFVDVDDDDDMTEQLREVLRTGQWLAEPVGTRLSENIHHGPMDIDTITGGFGATNSVNSSSSSGGNSLQFIPLSSYHDQAITLSINYVK